MLSLDCYSDVAFGHFAQPSLELGRVLRHSSKRKGQSLSNTVDMAAIIDPIKVCLKPNKVKRPRRVSLQLRDKLLGRWDEDSKKIKKKWSTFPSNVKGPETLSVHSVVKYVSSFLCVYFVSLNNNCHAFLLRLRGLFFSFLEPLNELPQ